MSIVTQKIWLLFSSELIMQVQNEILIAVHAALIETMTMPFKFLKIKVSALPSWPSPSTILPVNSVVCIPGLLMLVMYNHRMNTKLC